MKGLDFDCSVAKGCWGAAGGKPATPAVQEVMVRGRVNPAFYQLGVSNW